MSAEFFRTVQLPLGPEDFRRLPRNPAYKYELIGGRTWLTPRPRWYHALLDLTRTEISETVASQEAITFRPLQTDDWEDLVPVFVGAFRTIPPFGTLDDETRLGAARQALGKTREGGDGPLVEPACTVAVSEGDGRVCGAALVTLLPDVDLSDPVIETHWQEPPPADIMDNRQGLPHLTWIFVGPWHAGHGIGSALLGQAVRSLRSLGYDRLASTFLLGNESSTLWHWRNGFRLLAHPASWRELHQRWNP
jgi:GNAT superfamily N-acetyltransferase